MLDKRIKLLRGDITVIKADTIVNAANTSLLGGGGVDGAIHRKAGAKLVEECRDIRNKQNGCKVGKAVITSGGNLHAKYVIHTVGPTWNEDEINNELLEECYMNSLKLAEDNTILSIAFPNISTGRYGFPKIKAAEIAIGSVKKYFLENSSKIEMVIFVCYDSENYKIYSDILHI